MKTFFNVLLIVFLCSLQTLTFAQNNCPRLSGTWTGFYQDPQHLFEPGQYPITLRLVYDDGNIYGYTEASNDIVAANFGTSPHLIWASCKDSTITDLVSIPQGASCGDPELQHSIVNQRKFLTIYLHWENAMIGTDLSAKLHRIQNQDPLNGKLIHYAQNDSIQTLHSCH